MPVYPRLMKRPTNVRPPRAQPREQGRTGRPQTGNRTTNPLLPPPRPSICCAVKPDHHSLHGRKLSVTHSVAFMVVAVLLCSCYVPRPSPSPCREPARRPPPPSPAQSTLPPYVLSVSIAIVPWKAFHGYPESAKNAVHACSSRSRPAASRASGALAPECFDCLRHTRERHTHTRGHQ